MALLPTRDKLHIEIQRNNQSNYLNLSAVFQMLINALLKAKLRTVIVAFVCDTLQEGNRRSLRDGYDIILCSSIIHWRVSKIITLSQDKAFLISVILNGYVYP